MTGKMISPQSIAVATGATGLSGQEGSLFRFTVLHSLALVAIVGVITFVQAYYLPWMIPKAAAGAHVGKITGLSSGEIALIVISVVLVLGLALVALRGRLPRPKESPNHSVAE